MWANRSTVYPEPRALHTGSDVIGINDDLPMPFGNNSARGGSPDLFRQLARDILAILVEEQGPGGTSPQQEQPPIPEQEPAVEAQGADQLTATIAALCSRIQAEPNSSAATKGASQALLTDIVRALQSYAGAVSGTTSYSPR